MGYVRRGGGHWRLLPPALPPPPTVAPACWPWRRASGWERRPDTLRGERREAAGRPRAPRAGSRASQTVPTTAPGGAAARPAARAAAGARAPWAALAWDGSAACGCLQRGGRTGMERPRG